MTPRTEIAYVTSSRFKREENGSFVRSCTLRDGQPVQDVVSFEVVDNEIKETLDVSLNQIVHHEVRAAYARLKRPCVVEHAGIIFAEYANTGYPGGLTKPMWNTLGERFLDETRSAGRPASAVAAVGYCDGMGIKTFLAQTEGVLSDEPRGDRKFYWDTIFVPTDHNDEGLTYAQIVAQNGLDHKMRVFSQSAKAMVMFLEWRLANPPSLWKPQY